MANNNTVSSRKSARSLAFVRRAPKSSPGIIFEMTGYLPPVLIADGCRIGPT
jgi:hypothetical protein